MYYIASNNLTMPKSFKEIEQMFNIPEAKIKKEYNRIKKLVKIELTVEQQNEILKSYIRTFCDENKENFEYKILAIQIAKNINESSILEGKNTNTITGLSLYIAMKLEKTNSVTKDKICERRVNKNTLNKVYKQIKDYFDVIIPEKYKETYLAYILNQHIGKTIIVFVEKVLDTMKITFILRHLGFNAISINGKMTQSNRIGALNKFKNRDTL